MRLLRAITKQAKRRPELTALVLFGFFLRLAGTNPGYFAHGDELMYGEAVFMILNKTLGMEPQILGYYPPLIAWVMLVLFLFFFIPVTFILQVPQLVANLSDFGSIWGNGFLPFFNTYIIGKNWTNALYWGRYITVGFSTAVIVLTYVLSLKIFNKRSVAFLASLFVTLNYRLVLNSKIGFLDIFNVFFVLLALLSIYNLYKKPNFKKYVITWLILGLSFLVKYQTYVFPAFAIIHLVICVQQSKLNIRKLFVVFFNKGFIVGAIITASLVVASHYYHFLNWERVREMFEYQGLKYGLGTNNLSIYPLSYLYHIMLGPLLALSSIVGLSLALFNKKTRLFALVLVSVLAPISFLYFYYSTGGSYTRNLLVMLPILLIFSAYFFTVILEKLRKGISSQPIKTLSLLAFVILIGFSLKDNLVNALISSRVLSQTSARVLVEKWVQENIVKGSKIGVYQNGLLSNEKDYEIKVYSGINESLSFQELQEDNLDYAIIDFSMVSGSFIWWIGQPTDIGLKFWTKPNNLLSQNYAALALKELLWSHTLKAYLPKWQISGYNYAIIGVRKSKESPNYTLVKNYSFETDTQNWAKLNYFPETENILSYNAQGRENPGSLSISKEEVKNDRRKRILTRPGMLRWESPTIKTDEMHLYKIEAWVKSDVTVDKVDRNGFLRLDFYDSEQNNSLESRPIISFVSARYFGNSDWKKLSIHAIAPIGSKFIRVSFQTDQAQNIFSIDDVLIYKSDLPIDNTGLKHIMIDDDDLFTPNDGGVL